MSLLDESEVILHANIPGSSRPRLAEADAEKLISVTNSSNPIATELAQPSFSAHLQIMRMDHWVKNVFVLPGIVVALIAAPGRATTDLVWPILLGLVSTCLIASSNYVVNELLDAPSDRHHPTKCRRPVPSGQVNVPWAYAQWLLLMVVGLAIGACVSTPFAVTMLVLWIMGCVYNIRPLRTKDLPYLDVISEAFNNPLRMLAGWFIVNPEGLAPTSLLLSYWMVGAYFMAIKRFAEYRGIGDPERAYSYRKSFAHYNEPRLLVSIMFYAATAMLFFGAFLMRYRIELILSFPLVAAVMAIYLSIAFKPDSAVQAPEKLYREPALMAAVVLCALAMLVLFLVDLPIMHELFMPTVPLVSP